jgi:tetratricopeptide (TPR) repeat protein
VDEVDKEMNSFRRIILTTSSFLSFLSFLFCVLLLSSSLFSGEEKEAQKAFENRDYKQALRLYQACLDGEEGSEAKSMLRLKVAETLFKDQEAEKAFKAYLEALEAAPRLPSPAVSANEQKLYEKALHLYLDHSALEAQKTANLIRQEYCSVMVLHPDYYMLNFLVAAAYANLGMFDEFFPRFYESYLRYPDSFMAYKTKATLHIKLFERARTEAERQAQRQAILLNAQRAIEKNPVDHSLYKIVIGFSPESDKSKNIVYFMEKIISENTLIPRGDLPFYVNAALQDRQYALTERFLERARNWYPSSQIISSLQEMIDQQKEKR